MNALEKLGYVKQPQDEDEQTVEYQKVGKFVEIIWIRYGQVKKFMSYKIGTRRHQYWLDKAELKAILELMGE